MDRCIAVVAKEPRPGRVKTRLCPPLTVEEAAAVATASLRQTLLAVAAAPVQRRVLVLDGEPGDWILGGFEALAQRGDGVAARLMSAIVDIAQGCLLIGMDTSQIRPAHLLRAFDRLEAPGRMR